MRSRFSASATSIRSASPRVPTSVKACSRWSVGEVLAGREELALVGSARCSSRQPPPGGVDLQERVLDEVPVGHGACSPALPERRLRARPSACGQNSGDARPAPHTRRAVPALVAASPRCCWPARCPAQRARSGRARASRAVRASSSRSCRSRTAAARRDDVAEPPLAFRPILDRLDAREQLSIGMSSATQGQYDPIQALLDITQGTRVSLSSLHAASAPPELALYPDGEGGGLIQGWLDERARADARARPSIVPGLLGQLDPGRRRATSASSGRTQRRGDRRRRSRRPHRRASRSARARRSPRARRAAAATAAALVVAGLPTGDPGRRRARRADRAARARTSC